MENEWMLLGRILIGFYFFFFTFWNYSHREAALNVMKILPAARLLFYSGLSIEFFAGLFVMLGVYTSISAFLLAVFTVIATFMFHRFWELEAGALRTLNTIIFIGNLTVTLGALLFLAGSGLR